MLTSFTKHANCQCESSAPPVKLIGYYSNLLLSRSATLRTVVDSI